MSYFDIQGSFDACILYAGFMPPFFNRIQIYVVTVPSCNAEGAVEVEGRLGIAEYQAN